MCYVGIKIQFPRENRKIYDSLPLPPSLAAAVVGQKRQSPPFRRCPEQAKQGRRGRESERVLTMKMRGECGRWSDEVEGWWVEEEGKGTREIAHKEQPS